MDLLAAGASLFRQAGDRLDATARRVTQDPSDPQNVVDLKTADEQGAMAAKLIHAANGLSGSLLDVLA